MSVAVASAPLASAGAVRGSSMATETPALELSSYQHGLSAAHRLTFDVAAGDREIYLARVEYPAFTFLGFHALGRSETTVGALEIDLDFDGTPERRDVLRSRGRGAPMAMESSAPAISRAAPSPCGSSRCREHGRLPLGLSRRWPLTSRALSGFGDR
jgi:hypothetical protein